MNDHKGIAIKFLILVLLCMECSIHSVSGELRCIEREREALLRFKKGLIDEHGILSSWGSGDNSKECCKWEGVRCSNTTGHVIGLLLDGDGADYYYYQGLRGKISSALLELHHLNHLDLGNNDFGGHRIPEFIGSIKNLEFLNLANANFSGIVPPQLGNLTNLRTLDLSYNYFLRSNQNLNWLSSLSLLSRLDLSDFNLSNTNWLQQILKLRSLEELYLRSSDIADVRPSAGLFVNSSFASLSILDLSYNYQLTSSTFDWLFNISTSLVKIDLSSNQLDGPIPDAFGRLIFLEDLDLSSNMLEGEIPKSLGNLSHLEKLDLSYNQLDGPIPDAFGRLIFLGDLDLSRNMLEGEIPKSLGNLSHLEKLDLSDNKLTGILPVSLGQVSELEVLDVSFNSLESTVSEANFMKLHKLKVLELSFNQLILQIAPDWSPPFQLYALHLACCSMGPHFPKWIRTQRNLSRLDLSCAGISDEVPKWLWSLSHSLQYLNISHNQISGTIPDFSYNFSHIIDVSSNKFSGPIPLFHPNTVFFLLSQNMFSGSISSICTIPPSSVGWLDLSNNQLAGELPNCWEKMTRLEALNLDNNSFSGEIPRSLGSLWRLSALHLRDNNLSGELPSTLKNCQYLVMIDIGGNKLTGNIPTWIGANYTYIMYLSLRHNRFYGSIPPEICNLTRIQILDLSENNISGEIPQCFNNFTSLVEKSKITDPTITISFSLSVYIEFLGPIYVFSEFALVQWKGRESEYRRTLGLVKLIDLSSNRLVGSIPRSFSSMRGLISLNLSRNSLTGNIIPDIGQMEMLECLDLSRNQLSREIPTSLAQLHFLAVLDLANNNLTGEIPASTQLQGFNASVYAGNRGLCGRPLTLCPGDGSINNQGENNKEKDDGFMSLSSLQEFCISMALGFIVGFWGVVGSLVLKKSWRRVYFNFLDAVGDWLYVTSTIFLSKFRRS